MCSKPDANEAYRDLSDLMEVLREESAYPNPASDYGWAGARTFYGLLENS